MNITSGCVGVQRVVTDFRDHDADDRNVAMKVRNSIVGVLKPRNSHCLTCLYLHLLQVPTGSGRFTNRQKKCKKVRQR